MNLDELLKADPDGKGPRPAFLGDPNVERLIRVTLALAQELAVTRLRLDTLERLLAERSVMPPDAADAYSPDPDADTARQRWQQDYVERLLRALLD
jgi:hypothetical protein